MRIFVTGAAGFIGTATTKELISHGHKVLGLARSSDNAKMLQILGAEVHPGSLEDLASLQDGAKKKPTRPFISPSFMISRNLRRTVKLISAPLRPWATRSCARISHLL